MSIKTQEKIELSGFEELQNCDFLEINNEVSMHPTAIITGQVPNSVNKERLYRKIQSQRIVVKCSTSDNDSKFGIFNGYIDEICILNQGSDYYKVKIHLIGSSCKLNHRKYYRSYQDVNKKYGDIIQKVASEIEGVNIESNLNNDKSIGMPVIQYGETNWEFIKRMASNCNASIIVDETKEILKIIVGKGKGQSKGTIKSSKYVQGISERYYEKKAFENNIDKSSYEYIEVESKAIYCMCDIVTFNGSQYYVCGKRGKLIGDEIIFTYTLAKESYLYEKQYNNKRFAGCTILGNVVSTSNETLTLDLELKDETNSSEKYNYDWVPESGNVMYCMPKVGTKISLYFYNDSEKSAVAINCIRTNGGSSEPIFNKEERLLTTEHNKGFKLTKEAIHFLTEKEEEQLACLSLYDKMGIVGISKKDIKINADTAIGLIGIKVKIDSVSQLAIYQMGAEAFAQLLIKYLFEILCKNIYMTFSKFFTYKLIDDEPKEKKFEWGKWLTNLAVGLAVVVAVTAAVAVTVATCGAAGPVVAGAVVGGLASGGFAVASIQIGDLISGEVTDTDKVAMKVAKETFIGSVTGAISGGFGSSSRAVRFAVEEANAVGSTIAGNIADNLIEGKPWYEGWNNGLLTNMAFSAAFFGADELMDAKNLAPKGPDKIADDVTDGIMNSNVDNVTKNNRAVKEVKEQLNNTTERIAAKESEKTAAENVISEQREVLASATNRYTKRQARNRISREQSKINSARQSIRDLTQNKSNIEVLLKEAKINAIKNGKGINRGYAFTKGVFKNADTYKNVGKSMLYSTTQKGVVDGAAFVYDKFFDDEKK